jgi:hypothetical protein
MPSVIAAPERIQEQPRPTASPEPSGPQRQLWHWLVASFTSHASQTRQRPQQCQSLMINSSQAQMQPMDRLTCDYPHLYTLATSG